MPALPTAYSTTTEWSKARLFGAGACDEGFHLRRTITYHNGLYSSSDSCSLKVCSCHGGTAAVGVKCTVGQNGSFRPKSFETCQDCFGKRIHHSIRLCLRFQDDPGVTRGKPLLRASECSKTTEKRHFGQFRAIVGHFQVIDYGQSWPTVHCLPNESTAQQTQISFQSSSSEELQAQNGHDYNEVMNKALLFLEAQQSGVLQVVSPKMSYFGAKNGHLRSYLGQNT